MSKSTRALFLFLAGLALGLFFTGCNTTNNPVPGGTITYTIPDLPESGFLGDYSMMKLATAPEFAVVGRKIYINPVADLSAYSKVVIDPLSFEYYQGEYELTATEKERLTRYLNEWLNLKLKDRFQKVPVAGPGTIRIRTAVTDLTQPAGVTDEERKLADIVIAVVELEMADSVTGERFLAMIDPMGGVRFTIAKEDLSKEREMYINWMDGLSGEMESNAMKVAAPEMSVDTVPPPAVQP
jgi:hypothetical protein